MIKLFISLPLSFCKLFQNYNCLFLTSAKTDGCFVSRNIRAVGVLDRTSRAIFSPLLYNVSNFRKTVSPYLTITKDHTAVT